MRKKDKLYTANRFNQPLFMPQAKVFADGGWAGLAAADKAANPWNYADDQDTTQQYMQSKNAFGISKADNPFSKGNLSAAIGGITPLSIASGVGAAAGEVIGGAAYKGLSGGLSSGAGKAIQGVTGGLGNIVEGVPIVGGLTKGALNLVGGVVGGAANALFGSKVDQAKLNAAHQGTSQLNSFTSNATDFDAVKGPAAVANVQNAYSGGLFKKGSARRKNAALKQQRIDARQFAQRSVDNNIDNIADDQMNDALANFSAFGGPLGMAPSMGGAALDYGLAMDYLTQKKQEAAYKNKMAGMTQAPAFMPQQGLFALGGDLQSNGADFSTGLTHIDAGGSHEENPNEGVQLGVDQENVPNLVEEGETVFDDYVYSTRILADAATKQMFRLPKARKISFADISKKLEKEAEERPNDPISRAGLAAQMHQLAEQQERQKQEMEAQRAKEAFEALSPEEQVAVMEGAAQQEAMAQQAAMQQPSPEEIAVAQQQQTMADGSQAALGQEPQMNCFGGRINKFENGGQAYTKMLNSLDFHTQKEFDDWAKENSIDFGDLWKNSPNTLSIDILGKLWSNEKFKEALKKKNPALAHAFETKGYDFGTYVPTSNSRATIQSINKGNWKATNGQGWFGSDDLAFKQATEGMSEDEIKALTTEQLAERMAKTDAYKNTSKWLENSDNALMYLNTLINDPDTPEVAKKHALQYVKDGEWKDGYKYNYNDVFGKVRTTNPGTYWHSVAEANRGNQAQNFVINDDGTVEAIVGAVPTDWTAAGNYAWATPENDIAYNYYRRPAAAAPETPATNPDGEVTPEGNKGKNLVPIHNWEGWRYAGLFGPAVGLGMQMAGIGKPDTASLDAAIEGVGDVRFADYKPLGNYLTYRPLDIWYANNRAKANARATDRNIMNTSGGNRGTAMAGLLANGYNSQLASGELFRQAQEYNDALRERTAQFNRGTDQFNAEQYGATSRFNAGAWNDANRAARQLRLQAASQKADMDAGWYNGIYGNVAGLFKGISDVGVENKRDNMINWMISKGLMGAVDPNDPEMKKRVKVVNAEGGKVKRKKGKRGLTF